MKIIYALLAILALYFLTYLVLVGVGDKRYFMGPGGDIFEVNLPAGMMKKANFKNSDMISEKLTILGFIFFPMAYVHSIMPFYAPPTRLNQSESKALEMRMQNGEKIYFFQ